MRNLFNEISSFAKDVFPNATNIEHLTKLKNEAQEAIETPEDIEEYADCLIALFGACQKSKFSFEQLYDAASKKMIINRSRTWVKQKDGTYQHV